VAFRPHPGGDGSAPRAIGVGFELGRVADIRPQAHDVRLDAIVTEAGVLRRIQDPS
jgi:5-formyltetrahydrofolate cyclo-ligase